MALPENMAVVGRSVVDGITDECAVLDRAEGWL